MITNKNLFLISLGITPIISAITDFLKIEFLGFSLGILFFLVLLILVDMYTGIKAAQYNGEVLTSRKGYRSVDKLISYFMFICFTALLQSLLVDKGYDVGVWMISNFKILVFVLISLWEFHSVGENLQKRYGAKPKMFTLLDRVGKIIEKKVIDKIDSVEDNTKNSIDNSLPTDDHILETVSNDELKGNEA
jgi:phage-related holin